MGTFSEVVSRPRFAFGSHSSTVASPSALPVPTVSLYGCSSAFAAAAFSTATGSVGPADAAGRPASGSSPPATRAYAPAPTATTSTATAAISFGFCTVISPSGTPPAGRRSTLTAVRSGQTSRTARRHARLIALAWIASFRYAASPGAMLS